MRDVSVIEDLDPELTAQMTSHSGAVLKASGISAGIGSFPVILGVLAGSAFGASLPQGIVEVLNFALTLEYLEDAFYKAGLKAKRLIPAADREVFGEISKNEDAHVKLLKTVLGSQAVAKPKVDPTAGGAFSDVLTNYQTFLALSQTFEDTGVRAYKGQAGNLMSDGKILTVALQIHSVEARHAAQVRRIRGEKGWITGDSRGSLPAPTQPTYDGEGNTTQGGTDLSGMAGVPASAITEAFDEPLTREQVLAIAKPFIVG